MPEAARSSSTEPPTPGRPPVEAALRYLATRQRGDLADLIELAIERPESTSGTVLAPLFEPTEGLGWTAAQRARAILRLIEEGVSDRAVGPSLQSRRRRALQAAFRLHDTTIESTIGAEWGSSLTERFKQLRKLRNVFGEITSTQPMEIAWSRGVEALTVFMHRRFGELEAPTDWDQYSEGPDDAARPEHVDPSSRIADFDRVLAQETVSFRAPSQGAQPVLVDLFITNVFMKGRSIRRRITERLVTARGDEPVEYYIARGLAVGTESTRTYVPVRALWGCREEPVIPDPDQRPKLPPVTRLWFPSPLPPGQQAYFASEALFDTDRKEDDYWIDVDINHHGIPRGVLLYGGRVPIRGLTIRVVFEGSCVPEAAWWYAEANEDERYVQPPEGDARLLPIIESAVAHTFTDRPCQPREHYGIAFNWPHDAS